MLLGIPVNPATSFNPAVSANLEPAKTIIRFHMVIGKPQPDGSCRGLGICDLLIEVKGGKSAENDRQNMVSGEATNEEGRLVLMIPTNISNSKVISNYFSDRNFVMEADYKVSSEICRELRLPPGYQILKGFYPIIRNPDQIIIRF